MIVITGGAGFIGSNLARALNRRGRDDLLIVDDLRAGSKFSNLRHCRFSGYLDKGEFRARIEARDGLHEVEAVLHQGACTDTLEQNEAFLMDNNFRFSVQLLEWCTERRVPLVYASSAAVYGFGPTFREDPACEHPANPYGCSKLAFDQHVRASSGGFTAPVVGLRYFNVYGCGETHKGRMASVMFHFDGQAAAGGPLRLFRGSGGYGDGEQQRDFVHVDDVVAVNLWCLTQKQLSGIFNVGTGSARSFNDVAREIIRWYGSGHIEYVDFPAGLEARYQSYTCCDPAALRAAGYTPAFTGIEEGIRRYLDGLHGTADSAEPVRARASVPV